MLPMNRALLRVADPRSGARLCEAQRFKVPTRVQSWTLGLNTNNGAAFVTAGLASLGRASETPALRWRYLPDAPKNEGRAEKHLTGGGGGGQLCRLLRSQFINRKRGRGEGFGPATRRAGF
jgi:hypothetical protein